ncbi:hypothetical protein [Sphingobacterium sp. CZ-UAM]|uniref:hypothetical protein n=1 Tax=Sphingobacterium sp. CZ-UAM TaxID=1933868 RepID=UPI00158ABCB5|nr:hypothetical protein [Sphingobacterium sp. CZ-UAM]
MVLVINKKIPSEDSALNIITVLNIFSDFTLLPDDKQYDSINADQPQWKLQLVGTNFLK